MTGRMPWTSPHLLTSQVFNGEKKAERPGGEELALLVAVLRSRAADAAVPAQDKCVLLQHCLDSILDLSSR